MRHSSAIFDDPYAAHAAHRYLMETAPVLALRLDRSVRVVEANAEALQLLGDRCVGRPLTESMDLPGALPDGDETVQRLRVRTASGGSETVCLQFFPLADGTLALGNLDFREMRRQTAESAAPHRALWETTGQLDRSHAELFSQNDTKDKHAREIKEHEEDLRRQTLALLNLLEDAMAARTIAEHANRELSASEARFRSLVEGAPDTIYVLTNGRFRFLNAAACRLFGAESPEQLLGTLALDRVAPSFRELAQQRAARLEEFQEPAPAVEGELLRLDGRPISVDVTALPFVFEGERSALVFARDLTERKQAAEALKRSEQSFRAILDSAPDAIVLMREQGQMVWANSRAEKMFGQPRSALLARNLNDLLPERFRRENWNAVGDVNSISVEICALGADGEEFPGEISISRLESGEDSLVLGAIRDVTERKKAEQRSREFEIAMAEGLAANAAKSAFLSTISHEIRTPMNAIMGYSQLMLRDSGLSPTARANLQVINRSGEHLLNIINDVLDMAKVDAGRLEAVASAFQLSGLLRDLEAMFRLAAEAKAIRFEVRLEGEPADSIVADEGKVRQVLINLLGNAVKFTERGRIGLHVLLHNDSTGQMWLRASIQDTGVGISPEEQRNLFQPFMQGHAGQRRTRGGTGLGLAISRGIARTLGGDVTVSSALGEGSTFVFEIPVAHVSHASEDTRLRGRVVRLADGFEQRRILIADDGADNRHWLSQLLSGLGFHVHAVENGQAALDAWNWWKPHLILMDVHMPVMDGFKAARLIKAQPGGEHTAIVALTADVGEEQRRRALENRMDDFLPKPCAEQDLLGKIAALLGVGYLYEDQDPANRKPAADLPKEQIELSPALVEELRAATLRGDKALLNRLIPPSAKTLQDLADSYQYDRLMELLDEVCPH